MNANAKETLALLADRVAATLQPEGRANAAAASLRQIGAIGGSTLPLTLADCAAGFDKLAAPQIEEGPEPEHVVGRRKTCGELAKIAGNAEGGGDPTKLAAVFRAVEATFTSSEDPRQSAMAVTAAREAAELGG